MHLLLEQENNSSKCKIIIFIFELFKSVINILDFHELVSRVSNKKTHVHLKYLIYNVLRAKNLMCN